MMTETRLEEIRRGGDCQLTVNRKAFEPRNPFGYQVLGSAGEPRSPIPGADFSLFSSCQEPPRPINLLAVLEHTRNSLHKYYSQRIPMLKELIDDKVGKFTRQIGNMQTSEGAK